MIGFKQKIAIAKMDRHNHKLLQKASNIRDFGVPIQNGNDPSIITIKNITGTNLVPGNVVGLGDAIIPPADNLSGFQQEIIVEGVTPDEEIHYDCFGVLIDAILDEEYGKVIVSGMVKVRIKKESDAYTKPYACIVNGETGYLVASGDKGVKLAYCESTSTELYLIGHVIVDTFEKSSEA
jgi:hypothetical protein